MKLRWIRKPSKWLLSLNLFCFLAFSQQQAMAGEITSTWNGPDYSTGNWSDPANWSTYPTYPQNSSDIFDAVLSANNVTHLLDVTAQINSLTMNGTYSTLQMSGTVLQANASILVSGSNQVSVSNGGVLVLAAGSGNISNLGLDSTSNLEVGTTGQGGTLTVANLSSESGSSFFVGSGAALTMTGGRLGNLSDSGVLNGGFTLAGALQYAGDFLAYSGTTVNQIASGASVTINSGGLLTPDGTTNALSTLQTNAGSLIYGGAALTLNNPLTNGDSSGNGGGTLYIEGTTLTVNGALNNGIANQPGANVAVIAGGMTVGDLNNAANASLTVVQGTFQSTGIFSQLDSTGTLNGGTYQVGNGGVFQYNQDSSGNSGTAIQTIGSNASVTLGGGGSLITPDGHTDALANLTANFGNLTLGDDSGGVSETLSSFSNSGALTLNSSTLNTTSLSNSGALTVQYGSALNVTGPLQNQVGGNAYVLESTLSAASLTNSATFVLDEGSTATISGAVTNSGTLTIQNPYNDPNHSSALTGGDLTNSGTLNLSGGFTSAAFTSVNNSGAVNLSGGTLTSGTFQNQTGATVTVSGGPGGGNQALSATSFSNAGTVQLSNQGSLGTTGDFTNAGTGSIVVGGGSGFFGQGSSMSVGGNFNNQGSVSVAGTDSSGFFASGGSLSVTGDINNSGSIALTASSGSLTEGGARATLGGNFNNSGSVTIGDSASINAGGNYVQTGDGSYTQVQAGGVLNALSVDVQGGVLAGGGTINGNVTIDSGGEIAPGDDPADMAINGNLTMNGTLGEEIGDPDFYSPDFDNIAVNGNVSFDGDLDVDLLDGFTPTAGEQYTILTWTGTVGDENLTITDPNIGGGLTWQLDWDNADSELILEAEPASATPEPASLLLLGAGLAALSLLARRKRRA